MNQKIYRTVISLKAVESQLRMPYSKSLGDGFLELRIELGTDISRVLYFFLIGKRTILTNGFVKRKTSPAEINFAKKYRAEYLSRSKEK